MRARAMNRKSLEAGLFARNRARRLTSPIDAAVQGRNLSTARPPPLASHEASHRGGRFARWPGRFRPVRLAEISSRAHLDKAGNGALIGKGFVTVVGPVKRCR